MLILLAPEYAPDNPPATAPGTVLPNNEPINAPLLKPSNASEAVSVVLVSSDKAPFSFSLAAISSA